MGFTGIEETASITRLRENGLRVGVLFSGGPAPGGNRVIAAFAKPFVDRGIQVIAFRKGYEYLERFPADELKQGKHYVNITRSQITRALDLNALIIPSERANPGDQIGSPSDLSDPAKTRKLNMILDTFEKLRIGALCSIGGDDTMKTANFLYMLSSQRLASNPDLNFPAAIVHAPKTIDNDYPGIAFTFGFMSAAQAAGRAIEGFLDDAQATSRYHVIQLMGRKAGWLSLAASLYGNSTRVLIPEQFAGVDQIDLPALADELIDLVLQRRDEKKPYGVITVAEGLGSKLAPEFTESAEVDLHGHKRLSTLGISDILASVLEMRYKERTKGRSSIKFQPQRVGYETRQVRPDMYDTILTTMLGNGAFDLIERGQFGRMVTVNGVDISSIPFADLINPETLKVVNDYVDLNGDFYRAVRAMEETVDR